MNTAKKLDFKTLPQNFTPKVIPEIIKHARQMNEKQAIVYCRKAKPHLFETHRLVIRHFLPDDGRQIHLLAIDKESSPLRYSDHSWPTDLENCSKMAEYFSENMEFWAVLLKPDLNLIGLITFNSIDENGMADLGHVFHTAYIGQGYNAEAISLMVQYAFDKLSAKGVYAYNPLDWEPQIAPLRKIGMEVTKKFKASFIKDEQGNPIEFNGCRMEITKEMWERNTDKLPESYNPKKVPPILSMAESIKGAVCLPDNYMVTEHGIRKKSNVKMCPHSMAFPALMSATKTFMGLETNIRLMGDGKRKWFSDYDYFFHMGVSTEGFGLFFDLPHGVLQSDLWKGEPLKDCFAAEGLKYRLVADDTVKTKDAKLEKIKDTVCKHLFKDLPLIIFYNKNLYLFVMGYKDNGDTIIAYPFSDGQKSNVAYEMNKNSREYNNWDDDAFAIVLIDGITSPGNRKEIILRTLKKAYSMITETKQNFHDYGYGDYMYQSWMNYLNDDANYKRKADKLRHINPEKFDFAERRCFTAEFFTQAEEYLGSGALKEAAAAFQEIHNKMWEVHWLVSGKNKGKLLERETRDKIIAILRHCQALDKKAADNIRLVVERN